MVAFWELVEVEEEEEEEEDTLRPVLKCFLF